MAQIDPAVIRQLPKAPEGFDVEWKLKYSGTVETDKRIMTFVDNLWGIEVTGGLDQFEPLTIVAVKRTGLARRAGIRVGDVITQINDTPADSMTLLDAQMEIHESGRSVKIYVKGDEDTEEDPDVTVDFWFKPLSQSGLDLLEWDRRRRLKRLENMKLYEGFPWNDRKKRIYTESNCFMVKSTYIEQRERMVQLRATKEEYIQSLKDKAAELQAEKEAELEEQRLLEEEQEKAEEQAQFEALAQETSTTQTSEATTTTEFSKIVEESSSVTVTEVIVSNTTQTHTETEVKTEALPE